MSAGGKLDTARIAGLIDDVLAAIQRVRDEVTATVGDLADRCVAGDPDAVAAANELDEAAGRFGTLVTEMMQDTWCGRGRMPELDCLEAGYVFGLGRVVDGALVDGAASVPEPDEIAWCARLVAEGRATPERLEWMVGRYEEEHRQMRRAS